MAAKDIFAEVGAKTVNLMLLVTEKLQGMPYGGATNLNKALYYIDGINFINRLRPVSSFRYVKRPFGPTPDGTFLKLRAAMIEKGMLREIQENFHGLKRRTRLIPTEPADLSHFSKVEVDLIGDVAMRVGAMSAATISDVSHERLAYRLYDLGEEMPLFSFPLQEREPTAAELSWGARIASDVIKRKLPNADRRPSARVRKGGRSKVSQ